MAEKMMPDGDPGFQCNACGGIDYTCVTCAEIDAARSRFMIEKLQRSLKEAENRAAMYAKDSENMRQQRDESRQQIDFNEIQGACNVLWKTIGTLNSAIKRADGNMMDLRKQLQQPWFDLAEKALKERDEARTLARRCHHMLRLMTKFEMSFAMGDGEAHLAELMQELETKEWIKNEG